MRIATFFFAALLLPFLSSCTIGPCGVTWIWGGGAIPELPESKFDPAEAVYRAFLPGAQVASDPQAVYVLTYGDNDVPTEFLARFRSPEFRVITRVHPIEQGPGTSIEKETGRPVIVLRLEDLSTIGNSASARFRYITGSSVQVHSIKLARKQGQWTVTEVKQESESYF